VNVAAPNPVSNTELTRALGVALHRPTIFPLPGPLARLALGELADVALLGGVRALPTRLLASGFRFDEPDLKGYLAKALA
jgi:NAD dependent epimerase/dehydratase family enzyme